MKRGITAAVVMLLAATVGYGQVMVEWSGVGGSADTWLYNYNNTEAPLANHPDGTTPDMPDPNWRVELVVDSGGNTTVADLLANMQGNKGYLPGDDYVVDSAQFNGDFGAGGIGWLSTTDIKGKGTGGNVNANKKLYVKFYDDETPAGAGAAGFVFNEGSDPGTDWFSGADTALGFASTVNIFSSDPDVKGILHGGDTTGNRSTDPATGGWHTAVPEPGSFILMGLGLVVLGIRKKLRD